ncbi:MAG: ATP-binding protein [Candidatus Pacebacteria bacterium]|nr:ATP-binding protein [Candidatus Paceibacterota bacterium]
MELKSVRIVNYRSIDNISFDILPLEDKTFTYGLIGVNEAGKSTILKALALKDGLQDEKGNTLPLKKDFKDKSKPIEIGYTYLLNKNEIEECKNILNTLPSPIEVNNSELKEIDIAFIFDYTSPDLPDIELDTKNISDEDENKDTIQDALEELISNKAHSAIFWTAEDRYLISQPINLAQFATNPDAESIPLKNCFYLAGINNISERIADITGDSTEVEQLEKELGDNVTEHINNVWPKHPIVITFKIGEGLINFHVQDLDGIGKAKTADQRSDGFKQFVSFLLTVSAQDKNDELSNSILLLDEPETHLHPQAQEDLLKELIKITKNSRNNVVFFATHSNYMIDKGDLSRNYKIKKEKDNTKKEQFDRKLSTYASVTYEVFDIPSTDYHNELYSKLHQRYQDLDPKDEKKHSINNFDKDFLHKEKGLKRDKPSWGEEDKATLPTYIRNCIHHSDNGNTYKTEELRKSIELLRLYI